MGSEVHWLDADLLDRGATQKLLKEVRPTHLLHLAWPQDCQDVGPDVSLQASLRWVDASVSLLREFAESEGRRAVFAGSGAEYDWNCDTPGGVFSETAPLAGNSPYATAKIELSRSFEEVCRSSGLSGSWVRIFQSYGPGELPRKFVSTVVSALLEGRTAETTHGKQVRDYIYVRDVAEALITILGSDIEGPVNIGSGTGIQLRDIATQIGSLLERSDLIEFGALPARAEGDDPVIADISRLKNELGWQPRFSLPEGLTETIDWWRGRR